MVDLKDTSLFIFLVVTLKSHNAGKCFPLGSLEEKKALFVVFSNIYGVNTSIMANSRLPT